ncbi:restriction endonuclease subunit S, partial [Bifidobacterium adolescentis]|uniref:restriction endonuclease subunit S n=1 Tax=Bifidobacterium adolescentis TaxID=1680 RepID=UPI0034A26F7C
QPAGSELIIVPWTGTTLSAQTFGHYPKDTQVLKFDDFASIEISMPASENEQRQIGAFFDRLDSLITLHQRKYCGVVSWMLGVALVRLGSESDGAFGEMKHVLR